MRKVWGVIRQHLSKWWDRLTGIKHLKIEGFEVFNFFLMAAIFAYFCTSWFVGPYTTALKHALPGWLWRSVTGALALTVLLGFLEESYAMRRWGNGLTALFVWIMGAVSIVLWPHWFIGWLFALLAAVPTATWTKVAEFKIHDKNRVVSTMTTVELEIIERDPPVVKLPRRA